MSKVTLTDITSGYNSTTKINANNTAIEEAFDNTLSRDGSSPNGMEADLDLNSNRIVNLGSPEASNDAARWIDVTDSVNLTGTAVPALSGNSGKFLKTDGSTMGWSVLLGPLESSTDVDAVSLEQTAGLGNKRWRIVPVADSGTGSAELELVPGSTNTGSGIMSQILLYGPVGTNYERLTITRFGPDWFIESTANNSGTPRNITFQMGGKVSPAVSGQNALTIYNDASVDLNGAAYTASAQSWGVTRTRIADAANSGDTRLIIDTRTGTPASNTADTSSIDFRRGGTSKWRVGLNVGGAGTDAFDFAFGGANKVAIKSDGTIDTVGDVNVATGKGLRVNNQQVITNRSTGWSAATGTATRSTFDTATVTTAQLAERVKALIDNLLTHGLIGA